MINLFPPAWIIEKPVIEGGALGTTRGPIVTVVADHPDKAGTIAHELVHVAQWWVATLLTLVFIIAVAVLIEPGIIMLSPGAFAVHPLLYSNVAKYRLWSEVQATVAELDVLGWTPELLDGNALTIAMDYNLDITQDTAKALILGAK